MGNGLARGTCGVCLFGMLSGWSGSHGRACAYKGCKHEAVFRGAPRKNLVCMEHASRLKMGVGSNRTLTEAMAEYVAERAHKYARIDEAA
jgi:hypothetical protein